MKKMFFLLPIVIICLLPSCTKEEITVAPAIEKNDTPPVQMFGKDAIPYVTTNVFITDEDVMNALYVGNITMLYPIVDQFGNIISYSSNSQDWYTLRVPKYWGVYKNQIYITSSTDVYSISGQTLSRVRDMIERRGGNCIAQFYLSEDEPTGVRQQIVWVQQN